MTIRFVRIEPIYIHYNPKIMITDRTKSFKFVRSSCFLYFRCIFVHHYLFWKLLSLKGKNSLNISNVIEKKKISFTVFLFFRSSEQDFMKNFNTFLK